MAQSSPQMNMAVLANAAELCRLTVASMMSNESVRNFFGQPSARENVYRAVMAAVNKRIESKIRNRPTGQFNASVLQGQTGNSSEPSVTAQ